LQGDYNQLMRDYGKMEVISVQQEKTFATLEQTYQQE
jgi:hypothetical protein